MKQANDEVLAGGVAYRAHEPCWPAGVPTFDTDVVGAPLFIYQRPNEIVVIMESGLEVRYIYLNVPHSANPRPSWYGRGLQPDAFAPRIAYVPIEWTEGAVVP
jgi:hypothetical protein